MLRHKIHFFLLLFCLSLNGCFSTDSEYLLYSPTKQIQKTTFDENLRNHVQHLAKGPEVQGRDCESAIFGLIPLPPSFQLIPSQEKAFASAIEKAGPQYDALINVNASFTQYLVPPPLLRVICWEIKGVAVKKEPYNSTENKWSLDYTPEISIKY